MTTDQVSTKPAMYLSPDVYIEQRVDDQLAWYENKSAFNKKCYNHLQLVTLVAAVSIPIITLSSGEFWVRVVVAIIGSITALAAGLISLYQFREQWMDYRSTAESLKYEKFLFLTRSAPYAHDDAFSLFVTEVESTIIKENRSWRDKRFSADVEVDGIDA